MEMRNVLCATESRECPGGLLIKQIVADNADNLKSSDVVVYEDRPPADTVHDHSVNEIGAVSACANYTAEKTENVGRDTGKPKPPNIRPDWQEPSCWEEWYRLLWEYKTRFWNHQHR